MENKKSEIIIDAIKSIADATGQTANAIATIKQIKRTTGISRRQAKRLTLETETNINIAEIVKQWCEANPGYLYEVKIGNMKLTNIGKILELAQKEFEPDESIPKEKLDEEWLMKFLDVSGQTTDYDKQKVLAKVLAGQLKKPECVSYRTLRILQDLSRSDIILFKKAVSCSFSAGGNSFVSKINDPKYLSYSEIFYLSECGLMDDNNMKSFATTANPAYLLTSNKSYCLAVHKRNDSNINLECFFFTAAGVELSSLLNIEECDLSIIKNYASPYLSNYDVHLYKTFLTEKDELKIHCVDLLD